MRNLIATLCLTLAVLLGSVGCSTTSDVYPTSQREWKSLAEQGDADAQYALGWMYDKGRGVPQDDKTALKWYRLAAKQGDADAQNNLDEMYRKGRGVPQDYKAAVKWWTPLAEQGNAIARFSLGVMYEQGRGVPQNYKTAVKWYSLAAKQGNARAKSALLRPELQVFHKEAERLAGIERERQRVADIEAERLAVIERERQRLADIESERLRERQRLAYIEAERLAYIEAERLAVIEREKERVAAKRAKMQALIAPLKLSCSAFGFKDGSKEMSKCLFELYKLDQKAKQARSELAERARQNQAAINNANANRARKNRAAINNANANAAAQRELAAAQRKLVEQQLEERRFQEAMDLMRLGQRLIDGPPTVKCQFNTIMKSMVCR